MRPQAQGWYRDPFGIHEDRYFSCGWPTKLVRDSGIEAYDLPPDLPLPEGDLTPVPPSVNAAAAGPGAWRADTAAELAERMGRALFDYFDQLPHPS
jgi:hypothetical protein